MSFFVMFCRIHRKKFFFIVFFFCKGGICTKNLINLLNIIEDNIETCKDDFQKKELIKKREIIETMIYLIMKNDQ